MKNTKIIDILINEQIDIQFVKRLWIIIYAAVFLFSVTFMVMLFITGQPCASVWTMAIIILSGYMLNRELKIFKWKGKEIKKKKSKGKRRSKGKKRKR
jgi:membrane protein YdbS with pleckstrin-like domain